MEEEEASPNKSERASALVKARMVAVASEVALLADAPVAGRSVVGRRAASPSATTNSRAGVDLATVACPPVLADTLFPGHG